MTLSPQEELVVENTKFYIDQLFSNNVDGHDSAHSLRVYNNALQIAAEEAECKLFVVALAALLHDCDDHKLFQSSDCDNARAFLATQRLGPTLIQQVCCTIKSVSFSQNRGKKPATLEGKIVQDADRLDALGAIGIARTFAYGGKHNRSLQASVDHFYDKLLLLKDELNTEAAHRIATTRHQLMIGFLDELSTETGWKLRES
ncbi:HD domain-containing protein [Atopobium sp. oral taxon 810]|uniref:HD domain-containing protein n=1 Tax=Atopobium sp. oral taxon 810 TaxID=712158 RepID=UPI0003985C88|nr:HD domain-containing protein [Atopobium sp. oral taxon 810]ERI05369.1 HD domain protein [Atopobium sp. oral taxon 810 str. F0209]